MNLQERILQALQKGKCVPIIGAGASIPVGGPSWAGHLRQLCEGLADKETLIDEIDQRHVPLIDLASKIVRRRQAQSLDPIKINLRRASPIHDALAALECPIYLTTNFDDGMERSLQHTGKAVQVLGNDQLDKLDLTGHEGSTFVVKLCSSSHIENGGALTRRDFSELVFANTAVNDLLGIVLRSSIALFVGCGMRDPLLEASLQRNAWSGIRVPRHVALMSSSMPDEQRAELAEYHVDVFELNAKKLPEETLAFLHSIKSTNVGFQNLLVFDPGTLPKAQQVLTAISKVRNAAALGSVGIITESREIAECFLAWGQEEVPPLHVDAFLTPDLSDTADVLAKITAHHASWTALLAPYEFTVEQASLLAEKHRANGFGSLRFFDALSVERSRNKDKFREFLDSDFQGHDVVKAVPSGVIDLNGSESAEELFQKIESLAQAKRWKTTDIVVKPVNAAGSIGVRPLSLKKKDRAYTLTVLEDLLRILASLPKELSTRRCSTERLLVEHRLFGEEFSVEGRVVDQDIEILSTHWKPGIDKDPTRFFERVYVTLPQEVPPTALLKRATTDLVGKLGKVQGVFHAEYRVDKTSQAAFPLEVGLRPGGGTVSSQVAASCGVDMFEAAVRSSLNIPQVRRTGTRIVAAAEIFADKPGVLPPLSVRGIDGKVWAVRSGDEDLVKQWLANMLRDADREVAFGSLKALLTRRSDLCQAVLHAFDRKAKGIDASVESFDVWMRPGEAVTEEEACYVAGLRIMAGESLSPIAAVAEALAAMELCYCSILCEPLHDLRDLR
jgi:biotin carboxylase